MKYIVIICSWFCFEAINTIILVRGKFAAYFPSYFLAVSPVLFQNIFQFCTFLPNFQIFCPFLTFFCPFLPLSWKIARIPLLSRIGPVFSTVFYKNTSGRQLLVRREFLTQFSPVLHFIKKTSLLVCIGFAMQIKWLVSIRNVTQDWTGLKD